MSLGAIALDPHDGAERVRLGEGLAGAVAAQRRGMLANDYASSPHVSPVVLEHASVAAALAEPLVYQERLLGVVVLYHVEANRNFTGQDQRLLALLAAQAAIAIENARLFAESRQSYRELQRAQERLVQTEKLRALGEMSAGVAHDLNNVLAAVLGQAELLQMHVAHPDARGWLRTLEMAARDGAHIIRRLQDCSRQRPGQPSAPVMLAAVASEALTLTRRRWKDEPEYRGLNIEIRTAVEHLPPVLGDDAEIREVLTNLILNAVDAMPGGGSLEITGRVVESAGGGEFARRIKRHAPILPVVLLTGWGNRSIEQDAVRGAVDAVLGKPVRLQALLSCVDACLRRAEAHGSA